MSSSYRGRHHTGRHRVSGRSARLPRALSSSFVLPTLAAAALVVTATGASVAESPPALTLDFTKQEAAVARSEEAAEEATASDLATRRQAFAMQSAALQGRAESQLRAARNAARKAAAEKAARAKAEREGKRWVGALQSGRLTSDFGPRWGKNHDGLDIGAPSGTPLYAMSRGTVVRSFLHPTFGNKIEIKYWDGSVSWYAHMSARLVRAGDAVMPGDIVGRVGSTGNSTGPHLHLEIHPAAGVDNPKNPAPWLRSRGVMVG